MSKNKEAAMKARILMACRKRGDIGTKEIGWHHMRGKVNHLGGTFSKLNVLACSRMTQL